MTETRSKTILERAEEAAVKRVRNQLKLENVKAKALLALKKSNIQYAEAVLAEYERSGSVEFDVFRARLGYAAMRPTIEMSLMEMQLPASAPWQIITMLNAAYPNCGGCQQYICPKGCPND